MKRYLKIFMLSTQSGLTFASAAARFFESILYFVLSVLIFSNSSIFSGSSFGKIYFISGIYLVIILLYKYFYENALFVRYLVMTDSLERILTKPINPLFRILVEKIDLTSLLIGIAAFIGITVFGPAKYLLLIFGGIIISFALFTLVLSLLLLTSGKVSFEKLLLGLFLLGLLGFLSIPGAIVTAAASVIFLFISFRIWNFALMKYTSAGS